jgi:hypothetical protein
VPVWEDDGTMTVVPALHMGPLHPVEQLLVVLIAFGPFVVLAVVVYVVRRRDLAEEDLQAASTVDDRAEES